MSIKLEHLGQSGLFLELNGLNILVDPYLSNSVEELDAPDLIRQIKIPYSPEELTNIDWVLITHDHIDHCDPFTIPKLAKASQNSKFIGPEPVRKILGKWGINSERIFSASFKKRKLGKDVSLISVPSAHPKLKIGNDGMPIVTGWILTIKDKKIYIAGDTSLYDELFDYLKKQYEIDLGILPVNEDNYFRRKRGIIGNMSIREAFGLAKELRIKKVFPAHWDLFSINSALPEEIEAIYNGYEWPFELIWDLSKYE